MLAPLILARSDGFLVETPTGSLGVVDGLEEDEDGRVTAVIVLASERWVRTRQYRVPIEAVTALEPSAETLHVDPAAVETL